MSLIRAGFAIAELVEIIRGLIRFITEMIFPFTGINF